MFGAKMILQTNTTTRTAPSEWMVLEMLCPGLAGSKEATDHLHKPSSEELDQ